LEHDVQNASYAAPMQLHPIFALLDLLQTQAHAPAMLVTMVMEFNAKVSCLFLFLPIKNLIALLA
jgi:hypothetical protein